MPQGSAAPERTLREQGALTRHFEKVSQAQASGALPLSQPHPGVRASAACPPPAAPPPAVSTAEGRAQRFRGQVVAPQRLGVCLDWDLTKTPQGVYMDTAKNNSREYRATKRDASNMILSQGVTVNDLDERRWQGNGFAGHVQYVPYLGRELLRAGPMMERDIQVSTLPRENGRPLNVTQMGRNKGSVLAVTIPTSDEMRVHDEAVAALRTLRGHARNAERQENPHIHRRHETELSDQRRENIAEVARALPGLRSAGLASINPRMGTCGSLPDLTALRGQEGISVWRQSTPWAIDD